MLDVNLFGRKGILPVIFKIKKVEYKTPPCITQIENDNTGRMPVMPNL
ncbi:MAG: hypothetical protein JRI44_00145 [Deltaproteobacteria bacterium]|nr:hypothetical protein [Deltaproteobacteria bacterium]